MATASSRPEHTCHDQVNERVINDICYVLERVYRGVKRLSKALTGNRNLFMVATFCYIDGDFKCTLGG